MGTVEVFTKARMQAIEDSTVVAGEVNLDGDLILETRDGTPINAGHVKGADGSDATVPMATTSEAGKAFIASSTEVNTGTDASKIVTPATLNSRTATETRTGLVELATSAEVIAGTDTQRAVTPAGLVLLTATDARRGLVELATQAEAIAGTDTQRAVTPQGLSGALSKIQTLYGAFTASTYDAGVGNSGSVWWGERTVSFGVTFAQIPAITVYCYTTGAVVACTVITASTTGFTFRAIRFQAALSGTFSYAWSAVGRIP